MTLVLQIALILIGLKLCAELVLNQLNARSVKQAQGKIPAAFEGVMDPESYDKSTAYTLAKISFSQITTLYDTFILVAVLVYGVLPWVFEWCLSAWGEELWAQGLTLFAMGAIFAIPGIPFDWWSKFRLEAKYGFNKSSFGLWVMDRVKGIVLALVILYPLLCLLIAFFHKYPNTWWVWSFFVIFAFQILMMLLYPRFILPLFNKLTPLPEGELRDRLMTLSDRAGFQAQTIEVIDGSKRSGHSNAYFTGFGRFRRIVLYDTLIEQLSTEALEAVLAHEIGHYKLGHIPKLLACSAASLLAGLAIVGWLMGQAWFFTGFGFPADLGTAAVVPALILFSLLSGSITFWLSPLMNRMSRKYEYQADAFAKDALGSAEPLIEGLRSLHKENLSNLTPHPLYSAFHYSHPTLLERESALMRS